MERKSTNFEWHQSYNIRNKKLRYIIFYIDNNKEIEDDIKLIQNQIRLLETKYHII